MKKYLYAVILALVFFTAAAFASPVDYEEASLDIFGLKLMRPVGWELKVTSNDAAFVYPENDNVQLVVLEAGNYMKTLDDYYNEYNEKLLDKSKYKVLSTTNTEIDGQGAYYIKLRSSDKDLGHILFVRNRKNYALALKTPRGQYKTYEPILEKARQTLKFYKPAAE